MEIGGVAVAVEDPVLFGSLKLEFFRLWLAVGVFG
jgi:hypothetical protein